MREEERDERRRKIEPERKKLPQLVEARRKEKLLGPLRTPRHAKSSASREKFVHEARDRNALYLAAIHGDPQEELDEDDTQRVHVGRWVGRLQTMPISACET